MALPLRIAIPPGLVVSLPAYSQTWAVTRDVGRGCRSARRKQGIGAFAIQPLGKIQSGVLPKVSLVHARRVAPTRCLQDFRSRDRLPARAETRSAEYPGSDPRGDGAISRHDRRSSRRSPSRRCTGPAASIGSWRRPATSERTSRTARSASRRQLGHLCPSKKALVPLRARSSATEGQSGTSTRLGSHRNSGLFATSLRFGTSWSWGSAARHDPTPSHATRSCRKALNRFSRPPSASRVRRLNGRPPPETSGRSSW